MHQKIKDLLAELERRRNAEEGICPACKGTGKCHGDFCMECLGQKIILLPAEYDALIQYADSFFDGEH